MHYMYRLLVTLIRAIVRPVLNWSSHSNRARLLDQLWSFILGASRPSTSRSPPDDVGDPFPVIFAPSAAASMASCTPARSPREIEEGSSAAALNQNVIEEPPHTDHSPRIVEGNADERGLPLPESKPSFTTIFIPIYPSQFKRYDQKIIMCVYHISNL